ncbi:hypothetical protein KFL_004020120 [Klebsormidium nitens]|uniref:Uncharacterized protein n=1 Tax=Klebsormidium nitens TaxID=105231 RepID=A0A1Y1IHB8_KLENI|nr:hypothetical protein KFL_004020120 [Klebsormidium nitens]|eukprot:GAQ88126.1 hypothetical protein KFL_004020120 [Klebsormidium nitens]
MMYSVERSISVSDCADCSGAFFYSPSSSFRDWGAVVLERCEGVAWKKLLPQLSQAKKVVLFECTFDVTGDGLDIDFERRIFEISSNKKHLEVLCIKACKTLSAKHFAELGTWSCHFRGLRHLDLSWNAGLTSITLLSIVQAAPVLQELHINGCHALEVRVFLNLPAGLKKLYATWIPGLKSASVVRSLLEKLKQLVHLDVSFSVPSTAGYEILAQDAGHLRARWVCKNNVFTRRSLQT